MNQHRTLVVLAAGIGSRFGGGVKQLQPVGPGGEVIMDYAIHDALEAGFNQVIFIIRHDIQTLFDEIMGNRIRSVCEKRGVEVLCAYQEKEDLPGSFVCPADRSKPWGTGHALLACRGMLDGCFAVINADDYYGKDAYRKAIAYMDELEAGQGGAYGLVGFRLGNTLSDFGGVTRGLCRTDGENHLKMIRETKNIVKTAAGAAVQVGDRMMELDVETPVSMNMWVFTPDVLELLEKEFVRFLTVNRTVNTAEFLIPTQIGQLLDEDRVKVRVLSTDGQWFGMTFAEDMPGVREAFRAMTEAGIYPMPLF